MAKKKKINWEDTNKWPLWAKVIGVLFCGACGLLLAYIHNPEIFGV